MDWDLFFVTDCEKHLQLFRFLGIDCYGRLNSETLIGKLAARIRVSIFDFYFVFLPDKVYVVRAYKNGTATGKTAQFYATKWEQVFNRFKILLPHSEELKSIIDGIWLQHDDIYQLK